MNIELAGEVDGNRQPFALAEFVERPQAEIKLAQPADYLLRAPWSIPVWQAARTFWPQFASVSDHRVRGH